MGNQLEREVLKRGLQEVDGSSLASIPEHNLLSSTDQSAEMLRGHDEQYRD